jgi:hypothetical protein
MFSFLFTTLSLPVSDVGVPSYKGIPGAYDALHGRTVAVHGGKGITLLAALTYRVCDSPAEINVAKSLGVQGLRDQVVGGRTCLGLNKKQAEK